MINLGTRSFSIRPLVCTMVSIGVIGCGGIGALTPPISAPTTTTTDLNTTDLDPDLLGGFAPEDIARVYVSVQANAELTEGTTQPAAGPAMNVMQVKLQDAITTLTDPNGEEGLQQQAVDQAMEALFTSNLVILPTAGTPLEDMGVAEHEQMLQDAINALNVHITDPILGTPNTKDPAWEARNFLQLMQEALQVVGQQTDQCDPANLRDPGCQQLLADDEGGVDIDNVFPGFSRQVRSPFFIGAQSDRIQEEVIVPDVIGIDECAIVLKEIQGVKAVVRKKLIPIWVEPWFARATIVGFQEVWVWEFVPAEFLKTISYCNVGGAVVQNVDTTVVLERELLHFWSYLNKDITLTP